MRKKLEEMVRELRLDTVTIEAPVAGAEKVALFRECGIFVLPSFRENFPLGVLEAAVGAAMVVTPVGATPEFFTDGESALFIPPGDVNLLAAAIRRVVESEEVRIRLGTGARGVSGAAPPRPHHGVPGRRLPAPSRGPGEGVRYRASIAMKVTTGSAGPTLWGGTGRSWNPSGGAAPR